MIDVKKQFSKFAVITAISMQIISCGGSENDEPKNEVAGISGSGSPVTTLGPIDSFGSIIINDTKYETDNAEFTIDGQIGTQDDLRVGQVVVINGESESNQREAKKVRYFSNVIGPVESVDAINSRFTSLGQTIIVDEISILDGFNNVSALVNKQLVKISGFSNSEQDIIATRIDLIDNTSQYQVVGLIKQLNANNTSFKINNLHVNYASATINGSLDNAVPVVITGERNNTGVFIATNIKSNKIELHNKNEIFDIEGLINSFTNNTDFTINGIALSANSNTEYEGGTANDLGLNARVQITSGLNENNTLVATHIKFIHTGPVIVSHHISKGETLTYEISATDLDIGLWASLQYESTNLLELYLHTNKDTLANVECHAWIGSDNSRYCYTNNDKSQVWYITVKYLDNAANSVSNEGINFQLSSYLRRLPIEEPSTLNNNSSTSDTLFPGDRRAYRVAAGDLDSIFTLSANASANGFYLYIKADQYPITSRFDRECHVKGNLVGQKVCRIENRGVTNWYIIIEASEELQFTLDIEHITPTLLSANTPVQGTINDKKGNIYQFNTTVSNKTISAFIDNMSADVNLFMTDKINSGSRTCASRQVSTHAEQCTKENDTAKTWYIYTTGLLNANYTIQAFAQDQAPTLQNIGTADSISNTLNAGEQAVYKMPANTIGTLSTFTLDNVSSGFDFKVNANQANAIYKADCESRTLDPSDRICRLFNQANTSEWYITVQSIYGGSYTLNTYPEPFTQISEDTLITGTITSANGNLYKMLANASVEKFLFDLNTLSGNVDIDIALHHMPDDRGTSCQTQHTPGGVCVVNSQSYDGTYPDWYLLVHGDLNATYELTVKPQ